ncbi:hypothetical protein ACRAWD_22110 [Caulobacter segnis]
MASEVFLIDSGSTDGTIEIAEQRGAKVLPNRWVNLLRPSSSGASTTPRSPPTGSCA